MQLAQIISLPRQEMAAAATVVVVVEVRPRLRERRLAGKIDRCASGTEKDAVSSNEIKINIRRQWTEIASVALLTWPKHPPLRIIYSQNHRETPTIRAVPFGFFQPNLCIYVICNQREETCMCEWNERVVVGMYLWTELFSSLNPDRTDRPKQIASNIACLLRLSEAEL